MSLEEFNFDSLVMSSMDDKSGKPPIQPSPNLVNIGPFSIPKLNIPDGFYTNPATWSKSSTGSGHTEHEEDSYKVERDVRMEYLSSFQDNRFVSPSIAFNEQHEDMRTYNSGANRFHQEHSFHSQISSGEVSLGSSRTTPTNASANMHTQEKLHQMQLQQKLMQVHESTGYHSKTPSPRGLYQNLSQLSPAHSVPRSPHAYEYDGNDFTSYTDSRVIARSNMPHYTPSAAISAAAWRPSVAPATASSMQLRTTPTNVSTKYGSTPPASPSTGYHSGYNQAAQGGVNGLIYQVQFKCALRNYILGSQAHPNIMMGDFVVVEADRGEDIGVVVEILPMKTFVERRIYMKNAVDDENVIGRILRLASVAERQFLPEKFHDEENIVQFCRELAYSTYRLPMMIHDVEYQFDRHKLTIFYSSDSRVDFREFVRDLFSAYKARIWMKKIGTGKPVRIDNWASVALATGMQFSPDNK